jgi:hypothetical protein
MAATKSEKLSTNNLTIVMLLVTLLTIGVTVFAAKALYSTIARDTLVVQKKVAADKQLKENVKSAPLLVDAYSELHEEAGKLADALPTSADFPSLIVTLENMTRSVGLKLKSVTPVTAAVDPATGLPAAATGVSADASVPPAPQNYGFSVLFSGNYEGLINLLEGIETSARPMRVVNVQMTGSGSALSGQIDAQTYYQDKAVLPFSTERVK